MTTLIALALAVGFAVVLWADSRWPRKYPVPTVVDDDDDRVVDADGFIVGDGYNY